MSFFKYHEIEDGLPLTWKNHIIQHFLKLIIGWFLSSLSISTVEIGSGSISPQPAKSHLWPAISINVTEMFLCLGLIYLLVHCEDFLILRELLSLVWIWFFCLSWWLLYHAFFEPWSNLQAILPTLTIRLIFEISIF